MKSDPQIKALDFTPARLIAVIYVLILICSLVMMIIDEEQGRNFYAILLLMPGAIVALLLDIILRILLRKVENGKALCIWAIEILIILAGVAVLL